MNPSCIRQMFIMINGVAVSLVLDEIPNLVGDAGGVAAVRGTVRLNPLWGKACHETKKPNT